MITRFLPKSDTLSRRKVVKWRFHMFVLLLNTMVVILTGFVLESLRNIPTPWRLVTVTPGELKMCPKRRARLVVTVQLLDVVVRVACGRLLTLRMCPKITSNAPT